jgi:hypothetical protein
MVASRRRFWPSLALDSVTGARGALGDHDSYSD